MDLLNIIAIAVALAMDAFAVAVAAGVTLRAVSARQTFRLAWHFGLFQALMPVIGWSAGVTVRTFIERYAHWAAFVLLFLIGANMIKSSFEDDAEGEDQCDPTRGMTMVMLAVATSIDALAVGFTLSMIQVSIWAPSVIIGVVACAFTIIGMHLGKALGGVTRFSHLAEAVGGIVLIGIGVKILIENDALSSLFL